MQVHIQRDLPHSADAVWGLLGDFGNMSWAPGIQKLEVEGSGPGMVRRIEMGQGPAIEERLDALDDQRRHLEYSIPGNNPMPVTDYRAWIDVSSRDGGCRVDWHATAEAAGMSDEEAAEVVGGAYNMMIDWIDAHLKQ